MEAGKESVEPPAILFGARAGCNDNYGHQRDEEVACVEYSNARGHCVRSVARIEDDAGNKAGGRWTPGQPSNNDRNPTDRLTYTNVHITQTVPN